MADGSIIIDTQIDQSGLESGLSAIKSGVSGAAKIATAAIAAASAAIAAAGTAVYNLGTEYESTMAKAATLFGDVDVNMDALNSSMLSMSSETGVGATELGDALYSALSAGIPVTEDMAGATDFLEQSAQLAIAGFTNVDTAVAATAKVLNAYKMDVSETNQVQKVLMATQNKGITTVGELSAVLAQVTPTAAAMGVSFEQVGAAMATMTAQGTPTAQATTQLNQLIAELGKSGTTAAKNLAKAAEGTEYAGMSFTDMMDAGVPLNDVLDLMGTYADENNLSMIDMFSSIEAGKAALAISGENAQTFTENLAYMSTSADLVGDAYDTMMDTLENQTAKLKESAKNLGISIYNGMSGKLKDVAKLGNTYLATLQSSFNENGVEGLVGAVGDVIGDVISEAAEFAPDLIDLAVELLDGLVEGIVDNADTIADGLASALEAVVRGITKLIPNMLKAGLEIAKKLVSAIAESLPELIPEIVEALVSCLVELVSDIPELLNIGLQIVTAIFTGVINSIPIVFAGIGKAFTNLFTNADEIASAYEEQFGATADAYDTFKQALADADSKFDNAVADAEAKKQLATDLIALYDELAQKPEPSTSDITLMAEYAKQIAELYPSLSQYIDPATGLFTENTAAIQANIEAQAQLALVNAYKDYRDELYSALAEATLALKQHEDKQKDVYGEWELLKSQSESINGLYDTVFGDTGDVDAFTDNLTKVYNAIKESSGIENPLEGFVEVLDNGTVVLLNAADAAEAYELAEWQLSDAVVDASDAFDVQNGVLLEAYDTHDGMQDTIDETKASITDLNQTITESETAYAKMTGAANEAKTATENVGNSASGFSIYGDAAKEAGLNVQGAGTSAQEGANQFSLAGVGLLDSAKQMMEGASLFSDASDELQTVDTAAGDAAASLQTSADQVATTKEEILATAEDIQSAQEMATAAQETLAAILTTVGEDAESIIEKMTEASTAITDIATALMETMQEVFEDSLNSVASAGADVAQETLDRIAKILTIAAGRGITTQFVSGVKAGITAGQADTANAASALASAAKSAISSTLNGSAGYSIGQAIAQGIAAGIRAGNSTVITAAVAIAKAALAATKDALGIHSPSSVFREDVGQNVSEGIGLGILDAEDTVLSSLAQLTNDMQSSALTATMRSVVLEQSATLGGSTAQSEAESIIGRANDTSDAAERTRIDYRELARTIWEESPGTIVLVDMDGNYIGTLVEPTVSKIQKRKVSTRKKG